jgi:hypothetical protein
VWGKWSPKRFDRRKAEWTVHLGHCIDFKLRKLAFSRMEDYTDFDSFGCNSLKIREYKRRSDCSMLTLADGEVYGRTATGTGGNDAHL